MATGRLVVCVPARDEVDRLPRLLDALAQQTIQDFSIVLALNNTTDHSHAVISDFCARHPDLNVVVDDINFQPADAHAGSARRRAMDLAADLAGSEGFVLTTDADTRPPPDWIAQNLAAITRGLDVVGGKIMIDEDEPMSEAVTAARHLADRYWAHVREIEDRIDPVPWDLPPRHGDHTGASLCITVATYRQCGGVPMIASGEDRALVQAVLRQSGKLAHPIGIWTRVSPRIVGRASGGMAEHMKRLQNDSIAKAAIMLPSFDQWRARAEWRHAMRAKGGGALIAALEDDLPPMVDDMALTAEIFGPAQ